LGAARRSSDDRYRAPALDKGLDILEFLAGQPSGVTRAEIVKAIGRSAGEIYRMLERLVARDYVSRSAEGDRYVLTTKLFELGSQHPPVRRLAARAQPAMDLFTERTRQSVHLAVPERGAAIVVAQASGPANWEFRLRIGARLDLTTTSSGQTLLAFQDPARRHETLAIWGGGDRAAELAALEDALAAIRAAGHRAGASLQLVGVRDLSVPVTGPSGDAIAVLTCPYLQRVDAPTASDAATLEALHAVADQISMG
jgi:DNA-binding IclR family transcriptional regulator